MTKRVDYADSSGRMWRTIVPDDAHDAESPLGVPVGPPDLSGLDLPEEVAVRLHNQLHARGIFTFKDARRRPMDLFAAWQAALQVNVQRLTQIYAQEENPDAR